MSNDDVDRLSDKKGMHQSALTDLISIISKGWIDPLRKYRILLIKGKDVITVHQRMNPSKKCPR